MARKCRRCLRLSRNAVQRDRGRPGDCVVVNTMLHSLFSRDSSSLELVEDSQAPQALPIAWMCRRLRTTLWLAGLLIGVQTLSALPSGQTARVRRAQNALSTHDSATSSPASTSIGQPILSSQEPRAVLPTGWRRTADGWQHVSSWAAATRRIPLSQRVIAQRNAQPVWMRRAMASIRQIPPGSFALAQLACVGLLFWQVNRKKASAMDQTCHATGQ